jgi:hypothetical protein
MKRVGRFHWINPMHWNSGTGRFFQAVASGTSVSSHRDFSLSSIKLSRIIADISLLSLVFWLLLGGFNSEVQRLNSR